MRRSELQVKGRGMIKGVTQGHRESNPLSAQRPRSSASEIPSWILFLPAMGGSTACIHRFWERQLLWAWEASHEMAPARLHSILLHGQLCQNITSACVSGWQRAWSWMILKVPANPNQSVIHSVIL